MHVDLIIAHAAQLVTVASDAGPKRGPAMADLGILEDGAVACKDGHFVEVGKTTEILKRYSAGQLLEARGRVVMPGFVDPHTHVVWAGDRAAEFEQRVAGASYMEIMAAGGGIMSTVRATRSASSERLREQSVARLDRMLAHGTTTAEVKTGYGLELSAEIKQLQVIYELDATHRIDLVPTFLGAHAVPAEHEGRADDYVDGVVQEMLPAVKAAHVRHLQTQQLAEKREGTIALARRRPGSEPRPAAADQPIFCDVFCERGAFDLEQSRRVLEAAKQLGFGLKIHVDEFESLGGTRLAVELGAVSADHLVSTPSDEVELLAASDTIAVSLPGTPFGLAHRDYTPARAIIDAGGALALATDLNPGTCWCESMQFPMALACRYMQMTPAEAISAATLNAAYAIGLGQQTGSLQPGKWADLVIMDVPDYRHVGYRFGTNLVHTVVKKGAVVS